MTETFKVLDDRQHCLLRPQMYIGSVTPEPHSGIINYQYQTKTIVPGLIKIIEEILQNSVDEYIRTNGEFANKIEVSVDNTVQGTEITISDNGRGIPVKLIGDTYQPVLAWTKLKAGSNFDDSNRVGAGMNGVGSSLTNIFSTSFIGTSCDGSKKIVVTCSDNMANVDFKVSKSSHRGTEVKFVPDLEKFNLTEFTQDHLDVIRDRITNLAIMFEGITFVFNGEKIKFRNIKQIAKHFHESAISIQDDNVALVFAPSGDDEEFRCLSYVNSIYVKNGGSHIDYVLNRIIEDVRAFVKKKHKIDVLPNQIRQHLLFASWIRNFPSPKFDSQAKERITNSTGEISGVLGNLDYEKIAKQILNTPEIIDPMIAAILYKKELADRAALAKKQKGAAKVRVVNHIAATDPNPENRMILLAEGLCIEENTQIFTLEGSKAIKDIEVGDYVLTHVNRFRPVISKSFALKSGIRVNGVIYSEQHRLFVYDTEQLKFDFVAVKNLKRGIHKLIHNRAIETGFYTCIHHVKAIIDDIVITHRDSVMFSKTHDILTIQDDEIVTKTIGELSIGDVILL